MMHKGIPGNAAVASSDGRKEGRTCRSRAQIAPPVVGERLCILPSFARRDVDGVPQGALENMEDDFEQGTIGHSFLAAVGGALNLHVPPLSPLVW